MSRLIKYHTMLKGYPNAIINLYLIKNFSKHSRDSRGTQKCWSIYRTWNKERMLVTSHNQILISIRAVLLFINLFFSRNNQRDATLY